MNKNLHSFYMIASPIVIVILLVLTILYWKQKKDCEDNKQATKESLCLCNGPQMKSHCKPYNLYSNMQMNLSDIGQGPSELRMPYDVVQNGGHIKIRSHCGLTSDIL